MRNIFFDVKGRALALHLCSRYDNVKIILSSRRTDVLQEVARECQKIESSIEVKVLPLDLGDLPSLPSKTESALSFFGRVDILVNNGGVSTRSMANETVFDVDVRVANVDYLSYVSLTKALLPSWEKSKTKPMIINTSSVAGKLGAPVRTAYCGAKHAIQGWFDAFRIEQALSGLPIAVLNVVLGSTKTNIAHNAIVGSADKTFDSSDPNIDAGLDPEFVVKKVLAASYARCMEIWIAPKRELLLLYLNQYFPELAKKVMMISLANQYAVRKDSSESSAACKN